MERSKAITTNKQFALFYPRQPTKQPPHLPNINPKHIPPQT